MQELNVLRDLSEEIVKGRDPNISVLLGVRDISLLQESIFWLLLLELPYIYSYHTCFDFSVATGPLIPRTQVSKGLF